MSLILRHFLLPTILHYLHKSKVSTTLDSELQPQDRDPLSKKKTRFSGQTLLK